MNKSTRTSVICLNLYLEFRRICSFCCCWFKHIFIKKKNELGAAYNATMPSPVGVDVVVVDVGGGGGDGVIVRGSSKDCF